MQRRILAAEAATAFGTARGTGRLRKVLQHDDAAVEHHLHLEGLPSLQ